jgi:hypothetical protein
MRFHLLFVLVLTTACSKNVAEVGSGSQSAAPGKLAPKKQKLPPGHPPMGRMGKRKMLEGRSPMGRMAARRSALSWSLPAGWKAVRPSSSMRRAQMQIPGAEGATAGEMVVFHFPGMGGSINANVQRWVGQFKNPAGKPAFKTITAKRTINGLATTTVYHEGTYVSGSMMGGSTTSRPDHALLAAIVETKAGPWFFKGTGPAKTMRAQRKAFETFVASIKRKGSASPAKATPAKAAPAKTAAPEPTAGKKKAAGKRKPRAKRKPLPKKQRLRKNSG